MALTARVRHGEGGGEGGLVALLRAGAVGVEDDRDVTDDSVRKRLRRRQGRGSCGDRSSGERRRVGGVGSDQIAGAAARTWTHGEGIRDDVEGRNPSRIGNVGRVTGETRVSRVTGVTWVTGISGVTVPAGVTWVT